MHCPTRPAEQQQQQQHQKQRQRFQKGAVGERTVARVLALWLDAYSPRASRCLSQCFHLPATLQNQAEATADGVLSSAGGCRGANSFPSSASSHSSSSSSHSSTSHFSSSSPVCLRVESAGSGAVLIQALSVRESETGAEVVSRIREALLQRAVDASSHTVASTSSSSASSSSSSSFIPPSLPAASSSAQSLSSPSSSLLRAAREALHEPESPEDKKHCRDKVRVGFRLFCGHGGPELAVADAGPFLNTIHRCLENHSAHTDLARLDHTVATATTTATTARPISLPPLVLLRTTVATQRRALCELYASTGGSEWGREQYRGAGNRNWCKDKLPLKLWAGVVVHKDDGTVKELNLGSNNLQGTLPRDVWGALTTLEELNLYGNPSLEGVIPTEIGLLTNLRTLTFYASASNSRQTKLSLPPVHKQALHKMPLSARYGLWTCCLPNFEDADSCATFTTFLREKRLPPDRIHAANAHYASPTTQAEKEQDVDDID